MGVLCSPPPPEHLNMIKLVILSLLSLAAIVSADNDVDNKRNAKLFFISTSSTTSTVSTTTLCYTTSANAACGRRKRRNVDILNSLFPVSPSSTQWEEKDEDDILAEEFEREENLLDSGLIDASGNDRKGKFLLYWKTTTLTSTTTSFSSTTTLGTLECTPSGFTLSLCGKK